MLDTPTRRRIDDCRDILVGKLPDPKAQIEQITIGLIYKFMDDMDKESIDLGGSAKFFSDYKVPDPEFPRDRKKDKVVEFSRYAWDKLMHPKVTAAEMLTLYSEAIEGMEKNPNIPQLFRDIFKNAYLPYRDPETLKLFLKTIGEFEYTHSEKLGDAFEYLLSVMGSQGDAGQFRTPRHIIDFLVAIIDPDKSDSILDPACGTAGFLISAYKHILLKYSKGNEKGLNVYQYNQLTEEEKFPLTYDHLTPDDRKKLIQNFAGYDISPDMVRLSLVNLYLHGFNTPNIHEYDTLSSEERWSESFDVVLANPPFMSPKGGIRPHKKFTISSNRSEVLFVDYIAEHLNPKGKAGIIVPEGIIFQSGTAYKDLRKMLVENHLYAVVSLPAGVFNPYSGVKTSILLMDKAIAKKRDEILFIKIDNDGYNLGAQRTPVKGGQLEEAIKIIHDYAADDNASVEAQYLASPIAHTVPKTEIAKNGDFNLSGERYRITTDTKSVFPFQQLSDAVELVRGITFSKSDQLQQPNENSIKVATTKAAQEDGIVYEALYDVPREFVKSDEKLLRVGDILMSTANSLNLLGRVTFIDKQNEDITFGAFMTLIRPKKDKILPKLLFQLLKSQNAKQYYFSNANTTTNISNLKFEDLNNLQIPLPPLSIQEEIVAEIEGYQKIIDGAKAVVANYKPKIEIDPSWEMEELGEVCEIKSGGTPLRSKKNYWDGDIPWYSSGELNDTYTSKPNEFITKEGLANSNATLFPKGSLLIGMYDTAAFKMSILDRDATFNQAVCGIKPTSEIDLYFLMVFFSMNKEEYLRHRVGVRQRNLNKGYISEIQIPKITLETQRQIVAQIEKEQELVNANKQLIEIFEQKIKDRIAKVWGE
jgi:type I restriction enzyme M protein